MRRAFRCGQSLTVPSHRWIPRGETSLGNGGLAASTCTIKDSLALARASVARPQPRADPKSGGPPCLVFRNQT